LNVRRAKHSSFILRDHFFVIFGQKDINSFAEYAEILDLRPLFVNGQFNEYESEESNFNEVEIRGPDIYFVQP
jgi:hypothetical protein